MKYSYRPPFVVQPSSVHSHTVILLHGRGSNGSKFGQEFITSASSTGKTLAETFPGAKFIFPTAKKRRAIVFKRMPINQWFDIHDFDRRNYREHIMVDGLQETTEYIHDLIEQELKLGITTDRIVLGGLSQGCAASLYAMLCFDRRIGGCIGMSGWLPFVGYVQDILGNTREKEMMDDGSDIFATSGCDEEGEGEGEEDVGNEELNAKAKLSPIKPKCYPTREAINFLRENISLPSLDSIDTIPPVLQTPVFLGHGALDEKVKCSLGEEARDGLQSLGLEVTWKRYPELGHWYSVPNEIDDIEYFLQNTWLRHGEMAGEEQAEPGLII
ncbi:hypothetical protein ABW20_dc0109821 [Dactylellina cionopaga]|nr:hypothetical protein ABW20_dc0109821 [Dactylellina cionopaga]